MGITLRDDAVELQFVRAATVPALFSEVFQQQLSNTSSPSFVPLGHMK